MVTKINVDKDIRLAETLPAKFYKDENLFDISKKKIFLRSWHWIGDDTLLKEKNTIIPYNILPEFLDEPILVSCSEDDKLSCFSNVCTHRGNLLIKEKCKSKKITCKYHGRRFDNTGKYEYMPEFEETANFPRECDNLHNFSLFSWNSLLFVGLSPSFQIENIFKTINDRISFLPLDKLKLDETLSKDYVINANWALYCDNYLEGFHIPFVHNDLNDVLDYEKYDTEIDEYFNVQIGYAKDGDESIFNFPKDHQDYGKRISAYYYWIFPNIMFNVYPWGISVNVVKPISKDKTKVSFLSYVYDESKLNHGAGSELDKVEREDEFVVEGVNKGLKSRYYSTGRFSPTMEKGVHHFHKLISDSLNT